MENGVAWIFKTLIKVPIIIVTSFLIFNIFAFTVSYFRIIGAANALQQNVMSNNFLTKADRISFENYLDSLNTSYLTDLHIVLDTEAYGAINNQSLIDNRTFNNKRVQYGTPIDVGIVGTYQFVMPLQRIEVYDGQVEGDEVLGYGGVGMGVSGTVSVKNYTANGSGAVAGVADGTNNKRSDRFKNRIAVINRVIGMQYYSDLN